jgi:hypothetical protein
VCFPSASGSVLLTTTGVLDTSNIKQLDFLLDNPLSKFLINLVPINGDKEESTPQVTQQISSSESSDNNNNKNTKNYLTKKKNKAR